MKNINICIYTLFSILYLVVSSPPPTIEPISQIIFKNPKVVKKNNNSPLSIKRRVEDSSLKIMNSTATINYHDNIQTIEHQIILEAHLPENSFFDTWYTPINSAGISLDSVTNTCEKKPKDGPINNECTGTFSLEENFLKLSYSFELYDGDCLIIKYKYNKTKETQQILYRTEPVVIPLITNSFFCDYKYIIPDEFADLGLEKNLLKKESNNIYTYYGECPIESLHDTIRYSPKQSLWKADMSLSLEYSSPFTNKVGFIFPRYYKGGKLKNTYYRIFSNDGDSYKENDLIYENKKLKIEIPGKNMQKVWVDLHTGFINKLSDDFEVYFPESYYEINLTRIDQVIKDKALEIKNDGSELPDYYKIGKFVNSHIVYNLNKVGKDLSLLEIYQGKEGVCEHYTLLYNAMLNSIGYKTLYLTGWAFDKNQISGNKDTLGHAWTAALINGKWMELDATWGLFEGIPAGHIIKTLAKDEYSYYCYQNIESLPSFSLNPIIQMVTEESELIDPYPPEPVNENTEEEEENKNSEDIIKENEKNNGDNNQNADKKETEGVAKEKEEENEEESEGENEEENEEENKDDTTKKSGEIGDNSQYIKISFALMVLFYLDLIL